MDDQCLCAAEPKLYVPLLGGAIVLVGYVQFMLVLGWGLQCIQISPEKLDGGRETMTTQGFNEFIRLHVA